MTTQFVEFALKSIDRRMVQHIYSGSSAKEATNHVVQRGKLLPNDSVTLTATSRMVLHTNYVARVDITLGFGTQAAVTCQGQSLAGLMVLPGPCQVVITNISASPEATSGVTYTASCAS